MLMIQQLVLIYNCDKDKYKKKTVMNINEKYLNLVRKYNEETNHL